MSVKNKAGEHIYNHPRRPVPVPHQVNVQNKAERNTTYHIRRDKPWSMTIMTVVVNVITRTYVTLRRYVRMRIVHG